MSTRNWWRSRRHSTARCRCSPPHGRLCVISFHSLEDAIVKRFIQKQSQEDPVYAGLPHIPAQARPKLRRVGALYIRREAKIADNPRARSAVMRVAERVAA